MSDQSSTEVFESSDGHEQIVFCRDDASGLRAIIAIYSTALGPGLGGTRFFPYATEREALHDVLNLSKAMAYKAALADLDLGGGKAVIIGDPHTAKTEALLRAYGRFVQSLGGRYLTACDVGTYSDDMDVIARECDFVTGRTVEHGGAGDSSVLTAVGVYQGMRAAAEAAWGEPSLRGRRVGIAGVGKVGHHLVGLLLDDGADVVVTDVYQPAIDRVRNEHSDVQVMADAETLALSDLDVYSPCAMSEAIDGRIAEQIKARVICGAANNQLADDRLAGTLADRGVLYAPDFCVNAGGLIQVADELEGFSFERAQAKALRIYDTTRAVFAEASSTGVTPTEAAERLAERRMAGTGTVRKIWLHGR
ncbi:MAG TPA: Glu/Leu/Phe/Val dehydrogenase dimerization domain-containing protein [Nocardioidaceae bacterium]|nr:Glu/Leu/Phe/Val dehydrogenase dimerization domain-containing protein [Nocardioidaceae bacterium]